MSTSDGYRLLFYSPWMSLPLLLLALAVGTALVALFYTRVYKVIPRRVLILLVVLRSLAIAAVLLLLFKPVLSTTHDVFRRVSLALLVDTSRSMSVRDYPNSPSRLQRVAQELGPRLTELRQSFDLHLYTFDAVARRQDGPLPSEAVGDATNLSRAVTTVLSEVPRNDLAALVVISDGIHNAGGDPVRKILEADPPPIHVVGVGGDLSAESGFQDIGLTGVDVPSEATVNVRTKIGVRIDATGFADRSVEVQIRDAADVPVASARLVLDGRPGPQEVHLSVTPPAKGSHKYTVSIPVLPKERIEENNRHAFYLYVTEPRIKVLYIETMRPECRELKQVLETDPNIDVLSLVQIRKGTFLKGGNLRGLDISAFPRTRAEMRQFDVFIIGSLHRSFLTQAQMEAVRDLVRDEGKALLMIGGSAGLGAGGYGGTPLEEVLPLKLGPPSIGQITDPFTMELTPEGREHEIFMGTGDFFSTRGRDPAKPLPVLKGCNRVATIRPGAAVLAQHPRAKLEWRAAPVLAVQEFDGEGRSAVFTGDTTYQWHLRFRVLGRESPYVKFWGQMVRYLAGKDIERRQTEPGLSLALRKPVFLPGEPVVLQATVTETEGRTTNFAVVQADVTGPDGRTRTESLPYVAGSSGMYRTALQSEDAGKYVLTVRAEKDGRRLGQVRAEFAVSKPNQEFELLSLNRTLLERLARRTRGQYFQLTTLTGLFERLRLEQTAGSRYEETALLEIRLLDWPTEITVTHLLFVIFLAMVTTEWVIRRRVLLQ